jgi:hypothetical protein
MRWGPNPWLSCREVISQETASLHIKLVFKDQSPEPSPTAAALLRRAGGGGGGAVTPPGGGHQSG